MLCKLAGYITIYSPKHLNNYNTVKKTKTKNIFLISRDRTYRQSYSAINSRCRTDEIFCRKQNKIAVCIFCFFFLCVLKLIIFYCLTM